MRKLTRQEQAAIRKMKKLAETWPKTLEVFGASGSMYIIMPSEHNRVVADILGIACDGGDPDLDCDDKGNEYFNQRESEGWDGKTLHFDDQQ